MSDSLEDRVAKFVDGLNLNEIGNRWPGNWIETFARMETARLRREVEILRKGLENEWNLTSEIKPTSSEEDDSRDKEYFLVRTYSGGKRMYELAMWYMGGFWRDGEQLNTWKWRECPFEWKAVSDNAQSTLEKLAEVRKEK